MVVPLSTLRNWERELAVWAPDLNVVTLVGNAEARKVSRRDRRLIGHRIHFMLPVDAMTGQGKGPSHSLCIMIVIFS